MLRIKLREDGYSVSDFQALKWAEYMIQLHKESGVEDTTIFIANETCMRAFELLAMRGAIEAEEIEFYFNDTKLEYDKDFGIMAPEVGWETPSTDIQNETLKIIHEKWRTRTEYRN